MSFAFYGGKSRQLKLRPTVVLKLVLKASVSINKQLRACQVVQLERIYVTFRSRMRDHVVRLVQELDAV